MRSIDKELNALMSFHKYVENNIFCTRHFYKINSEIKLSEIFPIYLRNPNEFEIEYFRDKTFKKIFSILSVFPNLKEILDDSHFNYKRIDSPFSFEILQIQDIYKEYLKINEAGIINKAIERNDIKSFALYLSSFINEGIVLLEIKNWDKIDKAIVNYSGCNTEDVLDYDYREYFIEKYLNLFNMINFDLSVYKGISLIEDDFLLSPYTSNTEYDNNFGSVLSSPYYIDQFVNNNDDLLYLFFLMSTFDNNKYMRERKYSIDFITCLEFFLVKKLDEDKSKIQNQIRYKVRRCCKEVGYSISNNEIKELYNYRSLAVHGNFSELNRVINVITSRMWYKSHLDKSYSSKANIPRDNYEKEELIYCRLYEIFCIIFKLYCENKGKINTLKEITIKQEIDCFDFN